MSEDPVATLGRLRVFASRAPDRAWGLSTFADHLIVSLRVRAGVLRVALTVTR